MTGGPRREDRSLVRRSGGRMRPHHRHFGQSRGCLRRPLDLDIVGYTIRFRLTTMMAVAVKVKNTAVASQAGMVVP